MLLNFLRIPPFNDDLSFSNFSKILLFLYQNCKKVHCTVHAPNTQNNAKHGLHCCSICIVFKPLNTYRLRQNWTKLIFREKKLHNSSPWFQISGVTHLTINHLNKDTEITLQYIRSSSSTAWNFIKASTSYCIWLSLLARTVSKFESSHLAISDCIQLHLVVHKFYL